MPALDKITQIRERMKDLDPASDAYKAYEEVIDELRGAIADTIVVHKSPEPELCESCQ
jgi:hypothetical protein